MLSKFCREWWFPPFCLPHSTFWTAIVQLSSPLTSGGFLPRIHFPSAVYDQLSLLTMIYEEKMLFVHKHGNKEVNCFVRVHGDASKVISLWKSRLIKAKITFSAVSASCFFPQMTSSQLHVITFLLCLFEMRIWEMTSLGHVLWYLWLISS